MTQELTAIEFINDNSIDGTKQNLTFDNVVVKAVQEVTTL